MLLLMEAWIGAQAASMRPPPEGGGYASGHRGPIYRMEASMRPPPEGGGYLASRSSYISRTRFNEAAARGRRISRRLRASRKISPCFNEAAARGRRISEANLEHFENRIVASMRPPPEGGGYRRDERVSAGARDRFNEAAARGRRIWRSRKASCANGSQAHLREPRAIIAYWLAVAPIRRQPSIQLHVFTEHFEPRAVPGVFAATWPLVSERQFKR